MTMLGTQRCRAVHPLDWWHIIYSLCGSMQIRTCCSWECEVSQLWTSLVWSSQPNKHHTLESLLHVYVSWHTREGSERPFLSLGATLHSPNTHGQRRTTDYSQVTQCLGDSPERQNELYKVTKILQILFSIFITKFFYLYVKSYMWSWLRNIQAKCVIGRFLGRHLC
jgi:hypothetical protein